MTYSCSHQSHENKLKVRTWYLLTQSGSGYKMRIVKICNNFLVSRILKETVISFFLVCAMHNLQDNAFGMM